MRKGLLVFACMYLLYLGELLARVKACPAMPSSSESAADERKVREWMLVKQHTQTTDHIML
jgi:hypothetical protein